MASMYKVTVRGTLLFRKSLCGDDRNAPPEQINSLLPYLGSLIEIEPGTTFGDFFGIICRDYEVMETLFFDQLAGHSLKPYMDQIGKPSAELEGIRRLEVGWGSEYTIHKGKHYFYILPDFHGMGPPDPSVHGADTSAEQCYGTSLRAINDMRDLPFSLDTEVKVYKYDLDTKESQFSFIPTLIAHCDFTVYDVISGILDELVWHGYPDDKVRMVQELDQRMSEAKEAVAEMKKRGEFPA